MFKNFIWDLSGKIGSQAVGFCISVFLTRLLSPVEFGVIAMVMVIVGVANVFVDFGFYKAIVQGSNISQVQYSTVFFLNLLMAGVLALLCYALAEPLSTFYQEPQVKPLFRVVSLLFLVNGLTLVPLSMLYKSMKFKVISIFTLIATVISGTAAVIAALNGLGVWSLLIQSMGNSFLLMVFYFLYVRWLPSVQFNLASIKPLWKYGSGMFTIGIIEQVYARLDSFLIGKLFSTSMLGYYARAQSLDLFVKNFSSGSIVSVLFPQIAKYQHDRDFLRDLYIRYLHIICFVSIALSGCLFVCAKPLFIILFTEKWLFSSELFQLMAVFGFSWPISSLMCNIVAGVGNSRACVRMEIIKVIVLLPVYLFGFLLGIKGFLLCMIVAGMINIYVNILFAGREVRLTIIHQISVIGTYIIIGVISALTSLIVSRSILANSPFLELILQSVSFALVYLSLCFALKLPGILMLLNNAVGIKNKMIGKFA